MEDWKMSFCHLRRSGVRSMKIGLMPFHRKLMSKDIHNALTSNNKESFQSALHAEVIIASHAQLSIGTSS